MKHLNFKLFKTLFFAVLLFTVSVNKASAQIYQHNFGTANITAYPYTVAPNIIDTNLSGSSWTNSAGNWTSDSGSSGEALRFLNNGTITLSFTVNPNNQAAISSYSFWARRSGTGANAYTLKINGTTVGNGSIPSGGGSVIGPVAVSTPVTGLTGTVTIEIVLSGSTNAQGTFRLDDFTLNGAVTPTCTPAIITSVSSSSAPAGSIITITGSGFLSGSGTTGISFNGVPAAGFTVVSDNTITATIPLLATTGTISFTTNNCNATGPVLNILTSTCLPGGTVNDLFISEVYDAQAGENGAIEIYNGTGAPVNLLGYTISRSGSIGGTITPDFFVFPNVILQNGQTYIALKRTSTFCNFTTAVSPQLLSGFNADDELYLLKNGVIIDKVITPDNTGFTMIRNADATVPSTVFNAAEWNISNSEDCANLGSHNINVVIPSVITTQPVSTSVCEGAQAQFSVAATNITGFTYQWKVLNALGNWVNVVNGTNYSGANTNTLIINQAPVSFNGNQYYCEISSLLCTLVSNAAQLTVIPTPAAPVASATAQPTCTLNTGTIIITPVAGLTYSFNGSAYNTTTSYNNLAPGSYNITAQNTDGCISAVTTVTINPVPATPTAPVASATAQPTCTLSTGTITITPVAGLTYSFNGSAYSTTTSYSNLAPGSYNITAQNADGCTSAVTIVTINPVPTAPNAPVASATAQPTCTLQTGTIEITPVAGLTYSFNGSAYSTTILYSNLAPGSYNITAQNADGCISAVTTVTINPVPATPTAPVASATAQPTCTLQTGTIEITPVTGITYSFNGSAYSTTISYSNLAPGSYNITAQNTDGCTSAVTIVTINPVPTAPNAPVASATAQPTCTLQTGTIEITPVAGLTYSFNGSAYSTTLTYSNLVPGSYNITAQNADGCISAVTTVIINQVPTAPNAPVASATAQPTCTVTTGTIEVSPVVNPTDTYILTGPGITLTQTSPVFTGLAANTQYNISVQDINGCVSNPTAVTVNAIPAIPEAAFSIDPANCTTGAIVTITNPQPGFTYTLSGTNYNSGPQTLTTFTNVPEGSDYIITSVNGSCTSVTTIPLVIVPVSGIPAVDAILTNPSCGEAAGTITINAPIANDIQYSINGVDFQSARQFANVAAGNYTITAKNTAGCSSTQDVTVLPAPGLPVLTTAQGCENTIRGNEYILTVNALDNSFNTETAVYKWSVSGGAFVTGTDNTFNVSEYAKANNITFEVPLNIEVMVTTEAGCTNKATFKVDGIFCTIPKGISPNNDGLNDNFDLTGLNVTMLKIYNRYGKEVYKRANYTNQWYGDADNGDKLPTGTYYYMAEPANGPVKTGWVYINREE